jgi:hypothetical protein
MKITQRKLKLAWRHRGLLWRYRSIIRGVIGARRQIGVAAAAAGTILAAGVLAKRAQRI